MFGLYHYAKSKILAPKIDEIVVRVPSDSKWVSSSLSGLSPPSCSCTAWSSAALKDAFTRAISDWRLRFHWKIVMKNIFYDLVANVFFILAKIGRASCRERV